MRLVPRLLLAGLSGDSGKTVVSLMLLHGLRAKGLVPAPFKKGPDYIDAAWLAWAAGCPCRNLDTFMADADAVRQRFLSSLENKDVAVIEGNRGLFDGYDSEGSHSSAALARLLTTPVILVVDATKATRTLAALVKGCMAFEADVRVAGVVLNRVAGPRHEKVARESIESSCGIPVVGVVPKTIHGDRIIPQRHLGLVPPAETSENDGLARRFARLAQECLDLDKLMELASGAGDLDTVHEPVSDLMPAQARIGYFSDSVFTFYYPENLEALRAAGAELVPVSSLADNELPRVEGLYIGGGFPETHLEGLAGNRSLMASVRRAGEEGLPIFAECGGLIYLSRSLRADESLHRMAGLLDIELTMHKKAVRTRVHGD